MFYDQTVGDMNKTHNTNMIEDICIILFFFIFLVGAPPGGQSLFVFYGQTVGHMNKTHNTNMIENIFVYFYKKIDRWRHLAANHVFAFHVQTVGDMSKTHNTNMTENKRRKACFSKTVNFLGE